MSLDHIDEITHEPRLLFTEPWDPIVDGGFTAAASLKSEHWRGSAIGRVGDDVDETTDDVIVRKIPTTLLALCMPEQAIAARYQPIYTAAMQLPHRSLTCSGAGLPPKIAELEKDFSETWEL